MSLSPDQRAIAGFVKQFGEQPEWLVRAPGRVNLIGEHTDYNDGFVFPLAIDRHIWIAGRSRPDGVVHVITKDMRQHHQDEIGRQSRYVGR